MRSRFDVVVVGAGHAGCEAALAAARLGRETLLLTKDAGAIARMSCNPAVGGIAKGQVVREIDALGGAMGLIADRTGIQFKVLNGSRGPAVRGPRCQSDKALYSMEMARHLRGQERLTIAAGSATGFREREGRLSGLWLDDGSELACDAMVLTTGTFLRGLVHVGDERQEAGRWGEKSELAITDALQALGLRLGRMKTGTPPRVGSNSINRSLMAVSVGDPVPAAFSFRSRREGFPRQPQVDCWLTHTNDKVHEVIRSSLSSSALYSGRIVGRGPRYCPSIEDKVVRFADKERHQIFVEPEGLKTDWIYLNGLSMSFPPLVQERIVRAIAGLENAEILRPAYAVEYDMVYPEQLDDSLQVRALPGLFLAGQINGTSGYEEAAGQGLVAGINAALSSAGIHEPFVLRRHEAYIGVMVDDLVTLGTDEPYRLLSSRAEHRLLLGAETAYARLTPKAVRLGLISESDGEELLSREESIARTRFNLESARVRPDRKTQDELALFDVELHEESTLAGLLRRPEVPIDVVLAWLQRTRLEEHAGLVGLLASLDAEGRDRVQSDIRYEGYLRQEREAVARLKRAEEWRLPGSFEYRGMPGLSNEAVEKLERHRPRTLGQAGRIPGVPPSAVTLLLAKLAAMPRAVSTVRQDGVAESAAEAGG